MKQVSETTLTMNRKFDAPIERVFDAWLNPEMFRKWLFTLESTNKVAKNEPYIGGTWEIIDHREGKDYRAIGEYVEIDSPNKIVFTFRMPQFSDTEDTITVGLKALEDGCEMFFTQRIIVPHEDNWTTADIEKAHAEFISGSEHGWSLMFDGLNQLLTKGHITFE